MEKIRKKAVFTGIIAGMLIMIALVGCTSGKEDEYEGIYLLRESTSPRYSLPQEIRYYLQIQGSNVSIDMKMERDHDEYTNTYCGNVVIREGSADLIFEDGALSLVSPLHISLIRDGNQKYLRITSDDADMWPSCDFTYDSGQNGLYLNQFMDDKYGSFAPVGLPESNGPRIDLIQDLWDEDEGG